MPGDALNFLVGDPVVKAWRWRRCGALGKVKLVRRMEALEKMLETF